MGPVKLRDRYGRREAAATRIQSVLNRTVANAAVVSGRALDAQIVATKRRRTIRETTGDRAPAGDRYRAARALDQRRAGSGAGEAHRLRSELSVPPLLGVVQ